MSRRHGKEPMPEGSGARDERRDEGHGSRSASALDRARSNDIDYSMPYDGLYGYEEDGEFNLSTNSQINSHEPSNDPIIEIAAQFGDTNIDVENANSEDIDDYVEEAVEDDLVDDDFAQPEWFNESTLFDEEENIVDRRLLQVPPVYNTIPDGYNADADSFPYSGWYEADRFDPFNENLRVGMLFKDKEALKTAVKEWSIRNHRKFSVSRGNCNNKCWEVFCMKREEGRCGWKLRGSLQKKKNNYWEIVTYVPDHTCVFDTLHADHPNLTTGLIMKNIAHLVAADPSIRINTIVAQIKEKYQVDIAYNKAWYAKQKAIASVYGDWEESYEKLPRLLFALKQRNPGTRVSMIKSEINEAGQTQMLRLFFAFGPTLEGFKHCRPVMSIDATHLYGKYKGKLLIALSVDANGQIYPVAFGLVQTESKSNWGWFLKKLREAIGDRSGLCLISDRAGGIIAAIEAPNSGWNEPNATHRFCLRHVRTNFNTKFRNEILKSMVYAAGSEIEKRKFNKRMEELKALSLEAYNWCMEMPREKWSVAYDGGYRYGSCTTNLVECFNGVLKSARNLPISAMVILIFHRLVNYFLDKRSNGHRMTTVNAHGVTDKGLELTQKSRTHANHLRVAQLFDRHLGIAYVTSSNQNSHAVNLSERSCGCGPSDWALLRNDYIEAWHARTPVADTIQWTATSWARYLRWYRDNTILTLQPPTPIPPPPTVYHPSALGDLIRNKLWKRFKSMAKLLRRSHPASRGEAKAFREEALQAGVELSPDSSPESLEDEPEQELGGPSQQRPSDIHARMSVDAWDHPHHLHTSQQQPRHSTAGDYSRSTFDPYQFYMTQQTQPPYATQDTVSTGFPLHTNMEYARRPRAYEQSHHMPTSLPHFSQWPGDFPGMYTTPAAPPQFSQWPSDVSGMYTPSHVHRPISIYARPEIVSTQAWDPRPSVHLHRVRRPTVCQLCTSAHHPDDSCPTDM